MRTLIVWGLIGLVAVLGGGFFLLLWLWPALLGGNLGSEQQTVAVWLILGISLSLVALLLVYWQMGRKIGQLGYWQQSGDDLPAQPAQASAGTSADASIGELLHRLRQNLGLFWHRRARLLLVIGEPDEVTAIAPGLADAQWLEGEGVVLLWGGAAEEAAGDARLERWRRLRPRRPVDGIVWALSAQQGADAGYLARYQHQLRDIARRLRWQAPVHLWEVCRSEWEQPAPEAAVGCTLAPRAGPAQLEGRLGQLLEPLREQGLARMQADNRHDFLLRLAQGLRDEGIPRWRRAWDHLQRSHGVMPRGLWFSLAMPGAGGTAVHHWLPPPAWRGVLADRHGGRPHGWPWWRTATAVTLGLLAFWGLGTLLSFAGNRVQIAEMQAVLATLDQPREGDEQLLALNALVHELDRLDQRSKHGVPWYQRFGLSQNDGLLAALWPRYEAANNRLVRDPAAAGFERQLRALLSLAPGSPERASRAREAYEPLKAYLMMARPENVDASFLGKVLAAAEPARTGIGEGTWQGIAPNLWRFYAAQLEAHPGWRITTDPALVARARQLLISQLGQRNGEATLYRQVLDAVANQYPALGLQQMVGDTDAQPLFSTTAEVPGVFTRQAWEGGVRKAIEEVAAARREEIDWVLSDDRSQIDAELTPEALRESLTARYFQDYGRAWLDMLNSLRWQEAGSLADVVDQLTLMTDVRQSPFIALVNTLSYQGRAGTRSQALGESLLQSAQNLMGPDKAPVIEQLAALPKGPLEESFGPLLALLGKGDEPSGGDDSISLHAFLTRVTRVRLTLQQVSAAQDPQAMIQALAQTVFQGRSVDLTDTQSYGSLIAASLGSEWAGFGRALFVQPLDQAWQRILQPSAAGLNDHWQRAIVGPWNSAFAGRYPFAASTSDASLPMLGQMIRADSGHLDRFLTRQLGGVLRKDGNRWVPESAQGQGLRLDPAFLAAVNRLAELADVLYTDGGMGIAFELRAKPVRDLVQTTLTLDGRRLAYFNQRERWQRFDWPSASDYPGARLSWTHARSGERLLGDYPGTWGLIRLLERARVTPLDDSETRYRLVLDAPDGLGLTWHLRTDLGAGPLALLQLRGFRMPARIFLEPGGASRPLAR